MNRKFSRRNFLKGAAAIGLPTFIPSRALGLAGTVAPSNRIAMGVIGIGPRCRVDLPAFLKQPDTQFLVACDVQKPNRRTGRMMINRAYGNEDATETRDMLEVFAREDIDAVLIATGDRWHATASMLAAKAGKDVYSEKPCSMCIRESQELDDVITRYERIFQAGTQRRSVPNFQYVCHLAREGRFGTLRRVYASVNARLDLHEWLPEEPEPSKDELDWDRWLGPAPWRPYNKGYLRGWHGYRDFEAGSRFLDWAAHTIDLAQWALGMDGSGPLEFEPQEGEKVVATYANGATLIIRVGGFNGEGEWMEGVGTCPIRIEGDEGWIETGDTGKVYSSDDAVVRATPKMDLVGTDPDMQIRNFLDCVKSRDLPVSNSKVTRSSHVVSHAAAIARELDRKVAFDPVTESFPHDEEAQRLGTRIRRAPWHA